MSRAEKIQEIISKRKPYADTLKKVKDKLDKLVSYLKELEERKETIKKEVNDKETIERLRIIELSKLIETLEDKSANLENLVERFSRSTLNIGVFGEMGQGKSTLLQKLTGLSDNVIPARSGRACTAARSIIQHRPEGKTEAKVRFHSKETFLQQIIFPYYQQLGLQPKPASFEDFAAIKEQPALPDDAPKTSYGIYQRFLNDYWWNLDRYKALLDKEELLVTEEDKIKNYVAQEYDSADGKITNPECLAVVEVEISCKFPNSDIGNIALLDIPGLGDFRLGDEKLLVETMGQYVDIVLFIRKPDVDRDQWKPRDTDLYDLAKKSLNDLRNRCFIVLNLNNNNNKSNRETCDILEQELRNKQDLIPVVSCIKADCSDKNQPNDLVLEPVLKHLETEITNLDKRYARACLSSITQLENEVKDMLLQASNALENFANESKKFNELFAGKDDRSGLWGELTSELGKVLDQLEKEHKKENAEFKQRVDNTITNCQTNTGIPSIEEIEKARYALGGYPDAYYTYLREIRSNLSKHFLDLDADLQTTLEVVKTQVTNLLAEKGRLKDLSQLQGSKFFQDIVDQLPDKNDRSSLWLGFHTIGEFNVSFAGTILRKVRNNFSELFSNTNTKPDFSQADANKVLTNLNSIHAQVIEKCKKELETLYTEPNEIAYFMVQEFCDRVFYANGAKLEWREFLEAKKDRVWPEFKQLAARTKIKQEWEILVNQADEANKQLLQFLLSLN